MRGPGSGSILGKRDPPTRHSKAVRRSPRLAKCPGSHATLTKACERRGTFPQAAECTAELRPGRWRLSLPRTIPPRPSGLACGGRGDPATRCSTRLRRPAVNAPRNAIGPQVERSPPGIATSRPPNVPLANNYEVASERQRVRSDGRRWVLSGPRTRPSSSFAPYTGRQLICRLRESSPSVLSRQPALRSEWCKGFLTGHRQVDAIVCTVDTDERPGQAWPRLRGSCDYRQGDTCRGRYCADTRLRVRCLRRECR